MYQISLCGFLSRFNSYSNRENAIEGEAEVLISQTLAMTITITRPVQKHIEPQLKALNSCQFVKGC